jgi:hypothetical protein
MPESRAERSIRASIAADERWSRTDDRTAATAAARRAFNDRFERLVDPAGELPPDERTRRAASARRAHMNRLALRSAQSRRVAAGWRRAADNSKRTASQLADAADDLDRLADETDAELHAIQDAPEQLPWHATSTSTTSATPTHTEAMAQTPPEGER